MDRVLGSCIRGVEMVDREREEEGLDLSLSLHPSPSSPPRFQAVFACCYCPRKFRSSQALGGHQNAHKLQRNLARRGREATASSAPQAPPAAAAAAAADQADKQAAGSDSASAPRSTPGPVADAWGGANRHHRYHRLLHQGPADAAAAPAGASRATGEVAEEMIDLSLKL